jgi:hypothetical protein
MLLDRFETISRYVVKEGRCWFGQFGWEEDGICEDADGEGSHSVGGGTHLVTGREEDKLPLYFVPSLV